MMMNVCAIDVEDRARARSLLSPHTLSFNPHPRPSPYRRDLRGTSKSDTFVVRLDQDAARTTTDRNIFFFGRD